MKHPEFSSPAEGPSHGLPDFIVPFDGTQPEVPLEERQIVLETFGGVVDDILLRFASNVTRLPYTEVSRTQLVLPTGADEKLEISVEVKDVSDQHIPLGTPLKRIGLHRMTIEDGFEVLREKVEYCQRHPEQVVERWDAGDTTLKRQLEEQFEAGQDLETHFNCLADVVANHRIERQLGYNFQPVGLPEILGLSELITKPEVAPWQPDC